MFGSSDLVLLLLSEMSMAGLPAEKGKYRG
jgi:hypothetical protein